MKFRIASLFQQAVWLLCVLLGCTNTVQAQDHSLEATMDSLFAPWNGTDVPGIAVAYYDGGETVFKKAYGLANLEHRIVMRPSTVSDLGSVSKQFIGFAMALLEEQGHLSLDDDIRKHLPQLPDFEEKITIRNLFNHTSGLREVYNTLALIKWKPGDGIFQEYAQKLVSYQTELQFPVGSRYLYNNTEYMLLADIVEAVTNTEFHEWMQVNLFEPLEMHNTTIMHEQGQVIPLVATSYVQDRDGGYRQLYDNSTVQGAGGIYSTVEDLGKWMHNFSSHKVGSQQTIESMVEPGILTSGDTLGYALGIVVEPVGKTNVWEHGGASAGYRANLFYLPEHERGWVYLANSPSRLSPDLVRSVSTAFMGDVVQFSVSSDNDRSSEWEESVTLSNPEQFTGKYLSDELEVFYDIRSSEEGLQLVHRWLRSFDLSYRGGDIFELDGGPNSISFLRDDRGQVTGFVLDVGRTIGVKFRLLR